MVALAKALRTSAKEDKRWRKQYQHVTNISCLYSGLVAATEHAAERIEEALRETAALSQGGSGVPPTKLRRRKS